MFNVRSALFLAGVLLLLGGSWWSWKAMQPPPTDQEQVTARIEAVRSAIEGRKANQALRHLADEFTWNGQGKSELAPQVKAIFFEWRDVNPNITGLKIRIDGTHATATGKYSIALRPAPRMRSEVHLGEFQLALEKRNDDWLITSAQLDFQQ